MGATGRWRWSVSGAVLLSIALRLRFVVAPIGSDEGGFLAIARAWRHGADLYEDVWVDRPIQSTHVFCQRSLEVAVGLIWRSSKPDVALIS